MFDAEDPFNPNSSLSKSQYSFIKNGKRFDYHAPSKNLISPKKPVLSQNDHVHLSDLFEIRLSSYLRTSCSSATQTIFEVYRDEQYANTYIKSHEGAISFLNSVLYPHNSIDIASRRKIDWYDAPYPNRLLSKLSKINSNKSKSWKGFFFVKLLLLYLRTLVLWLEA